MRANTFTGTLLLLLVGHFAALGVTPLCDGAYAHPAGSFETPVHGGHTAHDTHSPCAPTHQESGTQHSPLGCLAMTGCSAAGIAALDAPLFIALESTAEPATSSPALLVSVSTAPETPPPIA